MRVTIHSGRKNKDGQRFNPNHNDRNFNLNSENATHIHSELTPYNVYITYDMNSGKFKKKKRDEHFEQIERDFYQQKFSAMVERTNQKYIQQRHREKCRTVSDLYESVQTCPEETLMYIGNAKDGLPPTQVIQKIILEQIAWEHKTFPQSQILTASFHVDETSPHFHVRRTFLAEKDGLYSCNQNLALKQMGIPLPNPKMPEGKNNNRKMTHTKMCREHFIEICRKHGLDITDKPRDRKSVNMATFKLLTEQCAHILQNIEPLLKTINEYTTIVMNQSQKELDTIARDAKIRYKGKTTDSGIFNAFLKEKGLESDFKEFREHYTESQKQAVLQAIESEVSLPEEIKEEINTLLFFR